MRNPRHKKGRAISAPKGRLVTFEGGEGAGKSTLILRLASLLEDKGYPVLLTREPGGTPLGNEIRNLLERGWKEEEMPVPEAELLLFLADRAQHVEQVIHPALAEGVHVLCDRFHDSTLAYQGFGRGLKVKGLCRYLNFLRHKPHRTYLLDLPPEAGLSRLKGRGRILTPIERENLEFHKRVRSGYLALARQEPKRFVVLDGRKPVELLLREVLKTYPFPSSPN